MPCDVHRAQKQNVNIPCSIEVASHTFIKPSGTKCDDIPAVARNFCPRSARNHTDIEKSALVHLSQAPGVGVSVGRPFVAKQDLCNFPHRESRSTELAIPGERQRLGVPNKHRGPPSIPQFSKAFPKHRIPVDIALNPDDVHIRRVAGFISHRDHIVSRMREGGAKEIAFSSQRALHDSNSHTHCPGLLHFSAPLLSIRALSDRVLGRLSPRVMASASVRMPSLILASSARVRWRAFGLDAHGHRAWP